MKLIEKAEDAKRLLREGISEINGLTCTDELLDGIGFFEEVEKRLDDLIIELKALKS